MPTVHACMLTQSLSQLNGILASTSWWIIFIPSWLMHVMHIPLQVTIIVFTVRNIVLKDQARA